MTVDRERVLHDVGKYIARTATNLKDGTPVTPVLADMLLRDVYGRPGEPRMSETFDALVPTPDDPVLADCRECLRAIDALEADARVRDPDALAKVAAIAREVAAKLKAWARG